MEDNVYFCSEYARSSKGSCKACQKAIPKNAVKIGYTHDFDHCGTIWFHLSCFFEKCFFRKQLKDDIETSSVFVGFKDLKDADQEMIRKSHEKLVLALKTEKPETKKGKRIIADDDESEWKPHTKKPKTATQSEKELAAEKQAYQIADHYEESHLEPPITNRMINSPFEPRIYTGGEHTHKIEDFLHIYISKQKDIVLVGIIHFYAKAPSIILKPGMKGIYLTVDQYRRLIDKRVSISNAIKQIKEDTEGKGSIKKKKTKQMKKDKQVAAKTHFDISKNKKVIVKSEFISWSQQVVVDIRDYSTPTEICGEIPSSTDKAVTLTEKQWNTLLSLHLKVIRDLADNFGYSEDFADELSA